jgi:hypothetical protein
MDPVTAIAITLGAGWASGINLYAAILTLGFMGSAGGINLPPDLQILSHPLVMVAAGVMYVIEFFADKIPGVDNGWDALHTFIRIPAGAILASQAVGDISPALSLAAGLMGGTLAATSHAAKASSRVVLNTTAPFANIPASIAEDVAVFGGLYTAMNYPIIFIILLVAFVALVIWLLPKIFRLLAKLVRKIGAWFRGDPAPQPQTFAPAVASGAAPASAPPPRLADPSDHDASG